MEKKEEERKVIGFGLDYYDHSDAFKVYEPVQKRICSKFLMGKCELTENEC